MFYRTEPFEFVKTLEAEWPAIREEFVRRFDERHARLWPQPFVYTKEWKLLPLIDAWSREHALAEIVPLSAATGENVDRLEGAILQHLADGEPLYPPDYLTDQPERFFVAELVREQVLRHTRAELPFSTAVVVDRFEEPDAKGIMRLYCSILVERASQKAIVVGRAGEMIKRIGTAAREELERFFDARVYLDLHVKVKAEWREDERVLDDLLR